MSEEIQVAAFESGQIRLLRPDEESGEVVLALPLSRLLMRMVKVPAEAAGDPVAYATPILQAASPYPDEALTVACETVSEGEGGASVVIAAALPESAAEDIGAALDERKLSVIRVDALVFGQLRGLWSQLGGEGRRLALFGAADCISLLVLDGETPVAIRAITNIGELRREVMLSLLEAEDFGGASPLREVIVAGEIAVDGLEAFASVRRLECGEDVALIGVAERSTDAAAMNVLPASWREVLEEGRFKAKLKRNLAIAGGLWALIMAVLFGVPFVFGLMTDHQKSLCKDHERKYKAVKEMKAKVEMVRKYSNHASGALEIMKAVSDRLPAGIELDSWSFKRDESVRFTGLASEASQVYDFKERMSEASYDAEEEDGEGERVFKTVDLDGPSAGKGGKQKFTLECGFVAEEDEE